MIKKMVDQQEHMGGQLALGGSSSTIIRRSALLFLGGLSLLAVAELREWTSVVDKLSIAAESWEGKQQNDRRATTSPEKKNLFESASMYVRGSKKEEDAAQAAIEEIVRIKTAYKMNLTVGVVGNEFFDPTIGRTGGFGE